MTEAEWGQELFLRHKDPKVFSPNLSLNPYSESHSEGTEASEENDLTRILGQKLTGGGSHLPSGVHLPSAQL